MIHTAIIKGGGANFTSIQAALSRLGVSFEVTNDIKRIQSADCVILPGVGAAGYAMKLLKNGGLIEVIRDLQQPLLGLCLGQQLLCDSSEEDNVQCLQIIPIKVVKIQHTRIIPHMGWNNLTYIKKDEPLLHGITINDDFYFVHSFAPEVKSQYAVGICVYGVQFAAIIRKDNFYGVQFHPEKSGLAGEKLLANFFKIVASKNP